MKKEKSRIDIELEKLHKIRDMLKKLIGIEGMEKYDIKQLRKMYYEKNPDVFANLISAYNCINEYTDDNEYLKGYNITTEGDKSNEYFLINCILQNFERQIDCGENHTSKGERATEQDIYLRLDFQQYVTDDIVSIKEIKENWDRYSESEQEKIKNKAQKNFDTSIWVLKEAVDTAIAFTEKDKIEYSKHNKEKSGEDIDI